MKKLVLVVAMFMFVCGGSFLVKAQNSEKAVTTKKNEPAKAELSASTAFVNDVAVADTATKDKPAEPVKE